MIVVVLISALVLGGSFRHFTITNYVFVYLPLWIMSFCGVLFVFNWLCCLFIYLAVSVPILAGRRLVRLVFFFFFNFNKLNFFRAVTGSQKNWRKVQKSPIIPLVPHMYCLHHYQYPHQNSTFVTVDEPKRTHHYTQNPWFPLGSFLVLHLLLVWRAL